MKEAIKNSYNQYLVLNTNLITVGKISEESNKTKEKQADIPNFPKKANATATI